MKYIIAKIFVFVICFFILLATPSSSNSEEISRDRKDIVTIGQGKEDYNVNLRETNLLNIKDLNEDLNRRIHSLNMNFSRNILGPVAHWYNSIRINTVHIGLINFFENLSEPMDVLNNILQLDFENVAKGTGRFALNSTLGFAGLFDYGKNVIGWERDYEDMGKTFSYWGMPAGYNIYLPLVGSTPTRKLVGDIVEIFIDPLNSAWKHWIPKQSKRVITEMSFWAAKNFLYFSDNIDFIDALDKSSLDSYIAFKEYSIRYRIAFLNDMSISELVLDPNNFGEDLDEDEIYLDDFDID